MFSKKYIIFVQKKTVESINMIRIYRFVIVFLCLSMTTVSSFAQEGANTGTPPPQEENLPLIDIEAEATAGIEIDATTITKPTFKKRKVNVLDSAFQTLPFEKLKPLYMDPTYKNYTMLYWKKGILDETNNDHLDAYLFLLQCRKVKRHFYNDFTWNTIRNKTQEYLKKSKQKVGTRFKFVQPLALGDYDFETQGFHIAPRYSYNATTRLQMSNNYPNRNDFCFPRTTLFNSYTQYATYNVALSLQSPFSLRFLPLSEEISRHYLDYINENNLGKNAYLVFYVKVDLFTGTIYQRDIPGAFVNEFTGIVEYIEVYADEARTRLLYHKDFRNKKKN